MATRFSNTLFPDNASAANFQAWTQFIEDTLVTTGGWVVTADTGQTLPSALTVPTGGSQKRGYRIYRMADSLQATFPVFMRVDFGSRSGVGMPGIWLTIGTGSSGTGTITGILWNGGSSAGPNIASFNFNAVLASNSYGSAATSRASFAMFINTNSNQMIFTIERTKDSSGTDTGDGLLLVYGDGNVSAGPITMSRYIICTVGTQPSVELGLNYILTPKNPSETFGGDIGAGVVIHFKGVAQQPGVNMLLVALADVASEGNFNMSIYGVTHTYQHCGLVSPWRALSGSWQADNFVRVCIRYD